LTPDSFRVHHQGRAMKARTLPLGIFLIATLAVPFFAHHSITAEFDSTKQVKLSGIVNNVDWMNPHTYVFVGVNDPALGKTRTWACELASPNELSRRGFTRASLKIGMTVSVIGTRAKDGSFRIHTDTLSADNSVLFKN
jgi:uncharacterized protein DUF6152